MWVYRYKYICLTIVGVLLLNYRFRFLFVCLFFSGRKNSKAVALKEKRSGTQNEGNVVNEVRFFQVC